MFGLATAAKAVSAAKAARVQSMQSIVNHGILLHSPRYKKEKMHVVQTCRVSCVLVVSCLGFGLHEVC